MFISTNYECHISISAVLYEKVKCILQENKMKNQLFCIVPILFILGCISTVENIPVGSAYDENTMESLVNPPKNPPCYLRGFLDMADRKAKKKMLMGRILVWSPKISISSGILELYIEEGAAACLDARMVAIIRIIVSYTVPSPFVVDINSHNYKDFNITKDELEGLQEIKDIRNIESFTEREKAALIYAQPLSKTPIVLTQK